MAICGVGNYELSSMGHVRCATGQAMAQKFSAVITAFGEDAFSDIAAGKATKKRKAPAKKKGKAKKAKASLAVLFVPLFCFCFCFCCVVSFNGDERKQTLFWYI